METARTPSRLSDMLTEAREIFLYRSGLPGDLRTATRRRIRLWEILLAVSSATFHFSEAADLSLVILVASFLVITFVVVEDPFRHFERAVTRLSDHQIVYSANQLVQIDGRGDVVGRIDLAQPYKISSPYSAAGVAVYTVTSTEGRIEICSTIGNADRLMRELLQADRQIEWPPGVEN